MDTHLLQILISLAVIIIFFTTFIILKYKRKKVNPWFFKTTSLILAVVFFVRYMFGDAIIETTYALINDSIPNTNQTLITLILNWMLYSVIFIIILYPFFSNDKYKAIIKYYGLGVALVSLLFIPTLTIGIVGYDTYYNTFDIRTILIAIELGIVLSYSLYILISDNFFKVSIKSLWFIAYIPFMLMASMPEYMLIALVGDYPSSVSVLDFTIYHRVIIYGAVLLPLFLYFVLRKKSSEENRGILLYIMIATTVSFAITFKFIDYQNFRAYPLHLCSAGMWLILFSLIFKKAKFIFYFTYFINVLGAFLALVMPEYSETANFFSPQIVGFYINHYMVFFIPILTVAFNIYKRPSLKEFFYSLIGFAGYFLVVLVVNAWFSNYTATPVDYFYINGNFIADKLGSWVYDMKKFVVEFNIGDVNFVYYPIYQLVFFFVYVVASAGMWFLYEASYTFTDVLDDIGNRKKIIKADELALKSQLNGRSIEEPMNEETKNKLVLKNFTKKYGTSKVYAVKDANLEIEAGQIFGLLGHNGAGKSTIIKSIVGIQPITEGSIEVCGYDVDKQPVMAKRNIGFVPDHYALYEKLTAREYINYIADLYEVSKEDRNIAIEKYTKIFELSAAFDNQIQTYSHGMKQKVTIIAALVHNPKVWIMDEPLTGLDPASIFQVKEAMREHAKNGNIVIFSSHLIDVVEQVCDKICIIKKGTILVCEYVSEIEKTTSLEKYFMEINSTNIQAVEHIEEQVAK